MLLYVGLEKRTTRGLLLSPRSTLGAIQMLLELDGCQAFEWKTLAGSFFLADPAAELASVAGDLGLPHIGLEANPVLLRLRRPHAPGENTMAPI